MTSRAVHNAIELGEELAEQASNAHDLWTWLPSCKAAQAAHGDYSSEHMPSVADILIEAATFIRHDLNPSAAQREEAGGLYSCPCGEAHSANHP